MTDFMTGRHRHIRMEVLREHPGWAYLEDMGPVREPTEAERQKYDKWAKDPGNAALIAMAERARNGENIPPLPVTGAPAEEDDPYEGTGWTEAEVEAVLAAQAMEMAAEHDQRAAQESFNRWAPAVRLADPDLPALPAGDTIESAVVKEAGK